MSEIPTLTSKVGSFKTPLITLIAALALASLIVEGSAHADPLDDNVDKAAHFGVSVVLVQGFMRGGMLVTEQPHITQENRLWSSLLTFGIGLAKESYDKHRGREFSGGDLAADGLGIVTGNLLFWQF